MNKGWVAGRKRNPLTAASVNPKSGIGRSPIEFISERSARAENLSTDPRNNTDILRLDFLHSIVRRVQILASRRISRPNFPVVPASFVQETQNRSMEAAPAIIILAIINSHSLSQP